MENFLQSWDIKRPDPDRIDVSDQPKSIKDTLKRILPFMRVHWRTGLIGALLILISRLMVFPQPLENRFLVDDIIITTRLDLLPLAILLMLGIKAIDLGVRLFKRYYLNSLE